MPVISTKIVAKPFVKWVGGKRQIINEIHSRMPEKYNKYFEPFVGGGAVFFSNGFKNAVICDKNKDLINVYKVIKNNVEELIQLLKKHLNNKEYYYNVRAIDTNTLDEVEQASRFIYLNKTCYNGLYRVNLKGQFNVPFGRYKSPLICDEDNLRAVSLKLKNTLIINADFENILSRAKKSDLIYFDPPYVPLSDTAYFVSYNKDGFSWKEQIRLRDIYKKLTEKGVFCILSNSYTPEVLELYSGYKIDIVKAGRAINSNGKGRGKINEVIVTNYEILSGIKSRTT